MFYLTLSFFSAVFKVGFEFATYTVGEDEGRVDDTVYIVKMRENQLLKDYTLTINVNHNQGPYPAVLGNN